MGSVRRESNISADLNAVLGTPETLLQYDITIRSNHDWIQSISGPAHPVYTAPPDITLELTYYIDQNVQVKHPNIHATIEKNIAGFLQRVNGMFTQRVMEPFRDAYSTKIYYQIKLPDLEVFNKELERAARLRLDAEFTAALEAKLSEN